MGPCPEITCSGIWNAFRRRRVTEGGGRNPSPDVSEVGDVDEDLLQMSESESYIVVLLEAGESGYLGSWTELRRGDAEAEVDCHRGDNAFALPFPSYRQYGGLTTVTPLGETNQRIEASVGSDC